MNRKPPSIAALIQVSRPAMAAPFMPSSTFIQREAHRPWTAMKPPVIQKPIGA